MTQKYRQDGVLVPITICRAEPCFVTAVKTRDKDGYLAVQLAAGNKKRVKKPVLGQFKKIGLKKIPEIIKEFRVEDEQDLPKVGDQITIAQVVRPGAIVKVVGISKGRGFSGVIKRWGFHSQPATHGQTDRERAPGAIGAQTPGRVIKGKKMPGHYGNVQRTVKNLEIVWVDEKKGEVWIKGAVPGHRGSWLTVIVEGDRGEKFSPLDIKEKNDNQKENNQKVN